MQRAALACIAAMFALPFANPVHTMPLTSFYTEWLALVLGLAALIAAGRPGTDDALPAFAAWLAAFALFLLLQPFVVDVAYPEISAIGALYVLWAAALAWLGRRLARTLGAETVIAWLAAALVLGGIANAAAAFLQFYGIDSAIGGLVAGLDGPRGAYGQIAQQNHFADYLCLALASIAWLRIRQRISVATAIACAAAFLWALAICGSRSTVLYLAAAAALACWCDRAGRCRSLTRLGVAIAAGAAVFFLLQIVLKHAGLSQPALPGAAGASFTSLDRAWGMDAVRRTLWVQALAMWTWHPFLGVGWGQYPGAYFDAAAAFAGPPGYGHAHNLVAEIAAETGIAGLAIVGAGGFAWWREARIGGDDPRETWWTATVLAIIAIHSLLEYPLWYANFLGIAAIAAGVATASAAGMRLARPASAIVAAIAALGIALAAGVWADYRTLETTLAEARRDARTLHRHQEELVKLHAASLLAPWVEVIWAEASAGGLDHPAERLALGARVQHFAPQPASAYWQAALLAAAGDEPAALAQLDRAVAVFPEGLPRFVAMAARQGDRDPAVRRLAEVGRERLPNR